MNSSYIFKIDNSIIQYHKSVNKFRICLSDFKDLSVVIDNGTTYNSNFYVLNKIPQQNTTFNIKLTECSINDLSDADLIFTPEKYKNDIIATDIYNRYNFALVICVKKNKVDLVRVLGNNIEYKHEVCPQKIYKVTYEESDC